jgi:predicted DNA-binding protein with PD1-like motif
MNYQLIHDGEVRTWAVILATGDEVSACLEQVAEAENLAAAHFTAIGAFELCILGYFDWHDKSYQHNPIEEQTEVASLIGDIALKDGKPKVHVHVVLGKADASACAGICCKVRCGRRWRLC